jgi:hypothetical protein
MKSLVKLLGFLLVLGLLWQWVKEKRQGDFKYHLPEVKTESKEHVSQSDSIQLRIRNISIENIPLIKPGDFALNQLYKSQLTSTYSRLFDSLQILTLSFSQVAASPVSELNAATVIQLLAFHESLPDRSEQNEAAITYVGLVLRNKHEVNYFVKDYLMTKNRWIKYMRKLHFLLMEQPQHDELNAAYLALLAPADAEQTLDYLKEVQFLERGHHDDYYSVNLQVLDRFDEKILRVLLDKVDDYSWFAAYPERDAEQGILEILAGR